MHVAVQRSGPDAQRLVVINVAPTSAQLPAPAIKGLLQRDGAADRFYNLALSNDVLERLS